MISLGHSISESCIYYGKSRQGYYSCRQKEEVKKAFENGVLEKVRKIREDLPYIGTRKLQYLLKQDGLNIGRDRLFSLLKSNKMLIKQKRKFVITTKSDATAENYENLLKDIEINKAEQVFVSDITYIRTREGFCYLSVVADIYTKKIMGKFLSKNLKSVLVLKSLAESLQGKQYKGQLIHHSDHGSQYSSRLYTNALRLNQIMISMAGRGRAWENPVAERIMGILKHELCLDVTFDNFEQAEEAVERAIKKYNTIRPHLSCGYLNPEQAHQQGKDLVNVWRKKLSTNPQKEERKKVAKKERRKTNTTTIV